MPAEVGPFADEEAITAGVRGTDVSADGTATFQSLHLLPMMAAAASWVGGDRALFRTGLVLGALGLLAMYGLASRLVRPVFAVAATAGLAANLGFVFVTRSLYSEVPLMLCLLGGLWALEVALATRSARRAVVAGALFGAALMTRIDAPLHLVGLLPVGAALTSGRLARSEARRLGVAALTATAGFALGLVDAVTRSRAYVASHADELGVIAVLLVAASATAATVVVLNRGSVRHAPRWLAAVTAVAVIVIAGALLVVRPAVQVDHNVTGDARQTRSLQAAEDEPVDGHRSYAEDSARWQGWYLGPLAGLAAVAGVALLAGSAAGGRATRVEMLVLGAASVPLLLYLVRPSIYPDHPWAMRRFLPLPTPFLLLAAVVVADRLWSWWRTRARAQSGALAGCLAVVLALALVVHPRKLLPVREFHAYAGYAGVVRDLCRTMGDDAVVVVLPSRSVIDESLPQAVRSMCGVPAAAGRRDVSATLLDAPHVASMAVRWADEGRRLWLVSDDPNRLRGREVPITFDHVRTSDRELQPTLTRMPHDYLATTRRLVAGPVAVP
ncbi:MAG: glycosyltransferase family 39 protein [Acidimicrobiales bacterium]